MQLTDEQFNLIKEQFKTLKDRSPFYAKKFEGIDLSDVQTQADFEKLPFRKRPTYAKPIRWEFKPYPTRKLCASTALRARRARRSLFPTPRRMFPIGRNVRALLPYGGYYQ